MARYINIWKEKSVVVRKAYDGDYGHWITEDECMVAIEDDEGKMIVLPVMNESYLVDYSADEYIKESEDEETEVILSCGCPRRDSDIKENVTEWICNQGCVDGCTIVEAVCSVVAKLPRNGMWKDEYSKSIDIKKIQEEYGEE